MSQAHARAWWEDVEHLREAAEQRIAARERAQREGRFTARTDRSAALGASSAGAGASVAAARAATTTALAVDLDFDSDLEPDPGAEPRRSRTGRFDRAELRRADAADASERAAARERPSRREELSRLAREQARAAASSPRPRAAGATRPVRTTGAVTGSPARAAASASAPARRTIEIRGQAAQRPAIAAVPDPVDAALPPVPRRTRPGPSAAERFAARPDRVAQWAFLLGLFLIVVAAVSAH